MKEPAGIRTIADFYAHALAIEREAAERYHQLADQMVTHHNRPAADLFDRLARMEEEHLAALEKRVPGRPLGGLKPWDYQWLDPESPESAPLDESHYLMTPYHALKIALANEERARQFFESVAASTLIEKATRRLAHEFAAEEREHIKLIEQMLYQTPQPAIDWHADLDPPAAVD